MHFSENFVNTTTQDCTPQQSLCHSFVANCLCSEVSSTLGILPMYNSITSCVLSYFNNLLATC